MFIGNLPMRVALLFVIGIFFIGPLLNAADWIVENHTPFTVSVQFKIRGEANETKKITINPNSENKYKRGPIDHWTFYGQIDSLTLYGIKALENGNYFGGNKNAVILTQTIDYSGAPCLKSNIKWNIFAIFIGPISSDMSLSIIPQQVQFLLVREGLSSGTPCYGDFVTLSSLYDAKTGVVISPSIEA